MSVLIRQAETRDFKAVLGLLKDFQKEALGSYGFMLNEDIALAVMPKFVDNSLVMFCDEKLIGVIAGFIATYPLDNSQIFQEAFWFVDGEYRRYSLFLLKALEAKCKERGITKIVMAHTGDKGLGRFYTIHGYRLLESHFLKHLEE